jgi:hypothetical protein
MRRFLGSAALVAASTLIALAAGEVVVRWLYKDQTAMFPRYHDLISSFKEKTGCPVIVNTSFNVRGEPIVGSPEDAFRCFMGTELDTLAVGNCLLQKEKQNPALKQNYENKFELD